MRRISDKELLYLAVDRGHISMKTRLEKVGMESANFSIGQRRAKCRGRNGSRRRKEGLDYISDSDMKEILALLISRTSILTSAGQELLRTILTILSAKSKGGGYMVF